MNICSLRAETLEGKPYEFTVADIPVVTGENEFVLLNRKFSPILKYDTIVLGSDVGIYVGDILLDDAGSEWFVTYKCGFVALKLDDPSTRRMLYEFRELKVIRYATEEEKAKIITEKIKIKFKYQGHIFVITDIVGRLGEGLVVKNIPSKMLPVHSEEVQQSTLMSRGGKRLYFGDLYKDLPIIMCYGRVGVQTEFGVYDIFGSNYIIRKRGNEE